MATALFRQEAIDAQRDKHFGDVALALPLAYSSLTVLAVFAAVALLIFAYWGEYTRKSHVQGYLAPAKGLVKVYAPETGVVVERYVREGQSVNRGDPLFSISTERGSSETPASRAMAIAHLEQRRDHLRDELAKQTQIDDLETQRLQAKLQGLRGERVQLKEEIATQQERTASARNSQKRYQDLLSRKFVAELTAKEKQENALEQQEKLLSLQRSAMVLDREIAELDSELGQSGLKMSNQRSAIQRSQAELEQQLTEQESRRLFVVSAPANGTVTTLLADIGQSAGAAQPLLSILPAESKLEAHLLVPSRSVGFLRAGQIVAMRYQAFAYQRFGSYQGQIKEISRTQIAPEESHLPVTPKEPVYRVTVAINEQSVLAYGKPVSLQAGMVLDADIHLERLRLIDWLFDPLYTLRGKI